MFVWFLPCVLSMLFWEAPHNRLYRLSRPQARGILLDWSTHSANANDIVYYTKSVGTLYLRPAPLILALRGEDDTPAAIAMIDRPEVSKRVSNEVSTEVSETVPTVWMICTAPDRHDYGVGLLKALHRSRNFTFAYTIDSRWIAEHMWHCRE